MDKIRPHPFRPGDQTPFGEYVWKEYRGPYVFKRNGEEIKVYPYEKETIAWLATYRTSSVESKKKQKQYYRERLKKKRQLQLKEII